MTEQQIQIGTNEGKLEEKKLLVSGDLKVAREVLFGGKKTRTAMMPGGVSVVGKDDKDRKNASIASQPIHKKGSKKERSDSFSNILEVLDTVSAKEDSEEQGPVSAGMMKKQIKDAIDSMPKKEWEELKAKVAVDVKKENEAKAKADRVYSTRTRGYLLASQFRIGAPVYGKNGRVEGISLTYKERSELNAKVKEIRESADKFVAQEKSKEAERQSLHEVQKKAQKAETVEEREQIIEAEWGGAVDAYVARRAKERENEKQTVTLVDSNEPLDVYTRESRQSTSLRITPRQVNNGDLILAYRESDDRSHSMPTVYEVQVTEANDIHAKRGDDALSQRKIITRWVENDGKSKIYKIVDEAGKLTLEESRITPRVGKMAAKEFFDYQGMQTLPTYKGK